MNATSNPNTYTYNTGVSSFADPSKTGYTFNNWYDDASFTNKVTDISTTQTGDITLYAKYTANSYLITYQLDGGMNATSNPNTYTYNTGVSSFADPSKTGYTFNGWYDDASFTNQVIDISSTQIGDVTLYAKYTVNSYSITYNLDGGINAASNPNTYTYNTGVSSFADPSKEGYPFEGWYDDASFTNKVTDISTTQTGDITLYAKYTPKVTYLSYDLKELDSYIVSSGSDIPVISAPYVAGHHFAGWVIEGTDTKWNPNNKMPQSDLTLVATYDKNTNNNESENKKSSSPKTGDTSNLVIPIAITSISGILLAFSISFLIKKIDIQ